MRTGRGSQERKTKRCSQFRVLDEFEEEEESEGELYAEDEGAETEEEQIQVQLSSVADPGCLSRILIFVHPGSRIPNPGSKNSNKREVWKKYLLSYLFL
jgi:hypothetical protein